MIKIVLVTFELLFYYHRYSIYGVRLTALVIRWYIDGSL